MEHTETLKKVTVQVPIHLLEEAQAFTGNGVTQTITAGLEKLAASKAYKKLGALRGSCKGLEIDLDASRSERTFS